MARAVNKSKGRGKDVTRYMHDSTQEPRTPETGHAGLLPAEENWVSVSMDNGWTAAVEVARLEPTATPIVVDIDPALDPMLMWAGKRTSREVPVLPTQRNEIVSESRIAQIIARAREAAETGRPEQQSLFADLERQLREDERGKRVEFYTHGESWKNKLICGDSLPVMESLLHYEGLAGSVQMIYIDPPYGIKYDSNFQQRVDSTRNDKDDGSDDVLTIKAFRDTWALGIHSYLSYLQERLYLCRELLTESGSVFVQINQENAHLVRNVLDEVFGRSNFQSMIVFTKTGGMSSAGLGGIYDVLIWYSKSIEHALCQQIYEPKEFGGPGTSGYTLIEAPDGSSWRSLTAEEKADPSRIPTGWRVFDGTPLVSAGESASGPQAFEFGGRRYQTPPNTHWKTSLERLSRLAELGRIVAIGNRIEYKRYYDDFPYMPLDNVWLGMGERGFTGTKLYAVQTDARVVERCLLMTTRPGDLVLDPTCGSGTTAYAAERLGRRWVTCDTSRVAINVARQRLLSSVFDHFVTRSGEVSNGFVYQTVDHVTLKSLAYDMEPERVELLSQPEVDKTALRVCGPFEVMSLGRYSIEDWKGWVQTGGNGDPAKLQNYIEVICRLYRPWSSPQGAGGVVHAVAETEAERIAISVGPLSGRVSARQVHDAVTDALALGLLEVHILGWAFEANVGELKSKLESQGKVKIHPIMIRPDSLAEGLKVTKPEQLFSPLAMPEIVVTENEGKVTVALRGVGVFDRRSKTTSYHPAKDGYIVAWYLDEDYDGDCFVDCQSFFDFKKAPNLRGAAGGEVDTSEFMMRFTSEPFEVRTYKRAAVKVVDVFGNESTVVMRLP